MKQSCLIIIFTLLTISGHIQAQSIEECCRMAREHYPEIRQYNLISQTEQFNLSNVARSWIPQIVISAQATYQSAAPTYPDILANMLSASGIEMSGLHKDQYKIALDINQTIWDGGQSKASRAATTAEAAEQRRATDVVLYALNERVEDIYFSILLLEEYIAQTEAKICLLQSNFDKTLSYCHNGVAMQADADAIEAELLTARQSLQQTLVSKSSFQKILELFIGQPLADEKLSKPGMHELPYRSSARPELALFDARLNTLSAREKNVTSSIMPRLSAFAQGYYGYPGMDMFKSMMSSDWRLNAMVGVRMSWNIGAFYTKTNTIQALRVAREQVEVQRDIFIFDTQLQTMQEEDKIARLRDAIADDERIAKLRSSVRIAAESQLTNGVIDTTGLLRKITDETMAILNKNTHEIELLQAIYKLKHTLNQ